MPFPVALLMAMLPYTVSTVYAQSNNAQENKKIKDQSSSYAVGQSFKDCADCPEMVVVPSGSFVMGSNDDLWEEKPAHRVTINYSFAVGKYEVTKGQYAQFVKETGYKAGFSCWIHTSQIGEYIKNVGYNWQDPGYAQTEEHPVTCVSWQDSKNYVRWLSKKTGQKYRLLSESEWEYVSKAGQETTWVNGNDRNQLCSHGNIADKSFASRFCGREVSLCQDGYVHTSPVGSFAPNGFGLYDVLGNVWEWVEDCYHDSGYVGAPSDGSARKACKSEYAGSKVLRGGAWLNEPFSVRAVFRLPGSPKKRKNFSGFRVSRDL